MTNTTESSNILLLCLGSENGAPFDKDTNISDLFAVFSVFGTINKIIIFQKKLFLKAFLEFDNSIPAISARRELHNIVLDDLGRIQLFFSPLQHLDRSSTYLEYMDYSSPNSIPDV